MQAALSALRKFDLSDQIIYIGASVVAQLVKNPPAMPETWL